MTSGTAGDSYRDNRNIGAGRPRDDDGGGGGAGWRPRLGAAITLFGSEVTLGPEHVLGLVTIGVLGGVEVPNPNPNPSLILILTRGAAVATLRTR